MTASDTPRGEGIPDILRWSSNGATTLSSGLYYKHIMIVIDAASVVIK
jgi:hypothetical protein